MQLCFSVPYHRFAVYTLPFDRFFVLKVISNKAVYVMLQIFEATFSV